MNLIRISSRPATEPQTAILTGLVVVDSLELGQARKQCDLTSGYARPAVDRIEGGGTVDALLLQLSLQVGLDGAVQLEALVQPGEVVQGHVGVVEGSIMRQVGRGLHFLRFRCPGNLRKTSTG